jgi:hypothetical protein
MRRKSGKTPFEMDDQIEIGNISVFTWGPYGLFRFEVSIDCFYYNLEGS